MKKLIAYMMFALIAISSVQGTPPAEKKDFVGEWKFESPKAPYGYQQGSLWIQEKEEGLNGEIRFADGTKVEMKDLKVDEGTLRFGINVEYNYVGIKATVEGKKMKGVANTPDGDLPFEATKVVKTE